MKLGIIANEFFEPAVGRMGGFGWAARQVAKFFASYPDLAVNVVFLAVGLTGGSKMNPTRIHETRLIYHHRAPEYQTLLREENFDLLLTIDYRPRYCQLLDILGDVPVIIWVRDPRPQEILTRLATLRIPTTPSTSPKGIGGIDCTSLSRLVAHGTSCGRPFLFATPALSLNSRIESTYGISGVRCSFLPNVVDIKAGAIAKHPLPRVIFLGRLDPIKRPWLFVELARLFPDVEFLMLGQSHFQGSGTWAADALPKNVKLLGHVDGEIKVELLKSAWVLVNTSIHEALATSFLEALACEVPLLSCTNQEGVVSRFGLFTGICDGDGLRGLPAFADGLCRLLTNRVMRVELGRRGRLWVERTHNGENFLKAFDALYTKQSISRPDCLRPGTV